VSDWKNTRNQVLDRDNHTCQSCGNNINLHAHHIKSRYDGGSDDLDNLTTLCQPCHSKLHADELRQSIEELNQIGWAQYKAMQQCTKDFMAQGGDPADLDARAAFSQTWPGWADVPRY
jgi:hypothetical protein